MVVALSSVTTVICPRVIHAQQVLFLVHIALVWCKNNNEYFILEKTYESYRLCRCNGDYSKRVIFWRK